ncbi:hypothetical protein U0070_027384 [Myodes glareolus]|uniref:Uncharacterized protein n=1 Tax=Myodes glareolus TaxID=447135 RepID=A0AAW0J9J9_MYOGA
MDELKITRRRELSSETSAGNGPHFRDNFVSKEELLGSSSNHNEKSFAVSTKEKDQSDLNRRLTLQLIHVDVLPVLG